MGAERGMMHRVEFIEQDLDPAFDQLLHVSQPLDLQDSPFVRHDEPFREHRPRSGIHIRFGHLGAIDQEARSLTEHGSNDP